MCGLARRASHNRNNRNNRTGEGLALRLFPSGCGCEQRKQIMFDAGNVGLPEAAIVATVLLTVLLAWRLNQ